ncbi:MAG: protein translocase subunit SecF [Candidatus Andersenbacteria bacterium]
MILQPKLWLIIASLTMLVCLGVIVVIKPLWGIDFVGGSLLEIKSENLTASTVTQTLTALLNSSVTTQPTDAGTLLIRTKNLETAQHQEILDELTTLDPAVEELRFENIGPTIGAELRRKAWIAILLSIVVTVVYLAYEFRHTGGLVASWKYGLAATIALVHDLLFVTAIFVILGRTLAVPIDALFVTAVLALAGYSVNDTIVLFNRLKQEWLSTRSGSLLTIMDRAIKLTMIRSLNTSITIFLTLVTLLLFGGPTIRWFIIALTVGTIVGAYSTIFVAPPFLYLLSRRR